MAEQLTGKVRHNPVLAIGLAVLIAPPDAWPQVCSGGGFGYAIVQIRQGGSTIANNFCNGSNTIAEVLPHVAEGTIIYKYRHGWISIHFIAGGWDQPQETLAPGEGAFIYSPIDQAVTFAGSSETLQPRPRLRAGLYLVGGRSPAPAGFEELLGFPPMPGDRVWKYDLTTPNLPDQPSSSHTYSAQGWDSIPTVGIAKAAFVELVGPPEIDSHPTTMIVCTNADVVFEVSARGTPPLFYQWRKNGANIRGANSSRLEITNVQVLHGGSYSVVVANEYGIATSSNALLCLCPENVPVLPPGDDFANRTALNPYLELIQSENTFATKEHGEPNHGGEAGGKSVWYSFCAPYSGIFTISTRGSTFDTLLGVYTNGTSVSNLVSVVQNDDKRPIAGQLNVGWFFTSEVKLNVTAGVDYYIGIDGFSCYDGKLVLSTRLEQTLDSLPVITRQPVSATVERGVTNTFSVSATGANSYRWFRNGALIVGTTGSTLTLTNVQPEDVGDYTVEVRSPRGRSVESGVATLEIGSFPSMLSRDKVVLQLCASNRQERFQALRLQSLEATTASTPALLVGAGAFQIINNTNSTVQQLEHPHCQSVGNASRWLTATNQEEGILVVHTAGSAIPTVLAAYTNRAGAYFPDLSHELDCATGNLLDGRGSYIRFHARTNGGPGKHWLVVDGRHNFSTNNPFSEGIIHLNYVLCPMGRIFPTNARLTVTQGEHIVFCAGVNPANVPARSFQWYRNDEPIAGATRDVFILSDVSLSHTGAYSVLITNLTTGNTNLRQGPMLQEVKPLLSFETPQINTANRDALVSGESRVPKGVAFRVQASTHLTNWSSIFTSRGPRTFNFADTNSRSLTRRYYRAVVP